MVAGIPFSYEGSGKQRKDIEYTVEADLDAGDALLQSIDSWLSWPGPCCTCLI